ncbi:hypothetical protein [Streptomyces sp. NPDC020951]|uniref:hypothetical protein n=1 Tax=Streptomyces sp. NPDC020951 TaxID=3365104 RepID=UPI00379937DE
MKKQAFVIGGAAVAALALVAGTAIAQGGTAQAAAGGDAAKGRAEVYPYDVTDTSHASKRAASVFRSLYTGLTLKDPDATMKNLLPGRTGYWDAVVGAAYPSYDILKNAYTQAMPGWGKDGKSYPTRIIGDTNGAVVVFTDTQPLFGAELRIIKAVDFKNGKITRQVDYWDGRHNPASAARVPADQYPTDLGAQTVKENAAPAIEHAARKLNAALAAGDSAAAAKLFSVDAVFEDMTTRTGIDGRLAIGRYLERALPALPYGPGTTVRHVLGSSKGGGYEWRTDDQAVPNGITALELDKDGLITRFTAAWDATALSDSALKSLAWLALED